jgi:hypothetical protein
MPFIKIADLILNRQIPQFFATGPKILPSESIPSSIFSKTVATEGGHPLKPLLEANFTQNGFKVESGANMHG